MGLEEKNEYMATTSRDLGDVDLEEEDGIVVATHTKTGVASQGETEAEALGNLAEALRLHGEPIPDDAGNEVPDTPWF
jgi:predicted RNase H-like HicB family nuclease